MTTPAHVSSALRRRWEEMQRMRVEAKRRRTVR